MNIENHIDVNALYPDGNLEMVESVLMPHFREQVTAVYDSFRQKKKMTSDQPVAPAEVDDLLDAIDAMIEDQSTLLDVDGLFKPVVDHIHTVRGEIVENLREQFYESCRNLLAGHKVTSRNELLKKGPTWFKMTSFPPYGMCIAFSSVILGEKVEDVNTSVLERIADILFPSDAPVLTTNDDI